MREEKGKKGTQKPSSITVETSGGRPAELVNTLTYFNKKVSPELFFLCGFLKIAVGVGDKNKGWLK